MYDPTSEELDAFFHIYWTETHTEAWNLPLRRSEFDACNLTFHSASQLVLNRGFKWVSVFPELCWDRTLAPVDGTEIITCGDVVSMYVQDLSVARKWKCFNTKTIFRESSSHPPPPHLTLYCCPLTDICVLPLGLSHLNWWCSAFYWPCSCFCL